MKSMADEKFDDVLKSRIKYVSTAYWSISSFRINSMKRQRGGINIVLYDGVMMLTDRRAQHVSPRV